LQRASQALTWAVWACQDWDAVGDNDQLGEASFQLAPLLNAPPSSMWLTLQNAAHGRIKVRVSVKKLSRDSRTPYKELPDMHRKCTASKTKHSVKLHKMKN
ncbi:hypothetical protein CYMTET_22555, partial [Cymbomonas tetramitiformis]